MPRNLPQPMIQSFSSNDAGSVVVLLDLTLKSGSVHVWSGYGSLTWNGNTYQGIGSLGAVGDIKEAVEVRADGTHVSLSGIDPAILQDCLDDIQLGAPAKLWLGTLANGQLTAAYPMFAGTVDKPSVPISADNLTITLALENRMLNLQRPSMRRYTQADQRYFYPDDTAFTWVESFNDAAFIWGAS